MLPGYRTGGTLHIVVNNQIGFTTNPEDARSTRYCTDVAKMIEAPIFHVNGDDPLSCVLVAEIALEFRQKFKRDVVIDMVCYRKHGHNETDEPFFTQPVMYSKIAKHPPISVILTSELLETGQIDVPAAEAMQSAYQATLDEALATVKKKDLQVHRDKARLFRGSNAILQDEYSFQPIETGVPAARLRELAQRLTTVPEGFAVNPKIRRLLDQRRSAVEKGEGIDWGTAEALTFASLLDEGTHVRLSGQDSERGTFSHRHAVLYDMNNRDRYIPLRNLHDKQAMFCVYNSLLSEAAVLGFDYGYSLDFPDMLCIWEAQFGDFANGAQVIIDQFIASSESKWGRPSAITLFLPHGYEGQGPEHSSARLERFLQLCAEDNMQVVNLTTPAQLFHCLRRQMKRTLRKPLVVMSPKSLLRLPAAVSRIDELADGRFFHILDDASRPSPSKTKRVILCSGKVYYDLDAYRTANKIGDTTIIRVEMLYPLNKSRIRELVPQNNDISIVWCQEEPKNMGAWQFIAPQLAETLGRMPKYAGRKASASPAVGSLAVHKLEQAELVKMAFEL
jgi:2-oxoglutarate dehydrogenase E1 component